MKRCIALVLLVASGLIAQVPPQTAAKSSSQAAGQAPAKPDPWLALRFLMGSWEAKTTGGVAQAQVSAGYAFRLELRDHVLARHSRSSACSSPDDFECLHSDILYIYPAGNGQTLQAIYFDNEGHVIRYDVSMPKPESMVLLSDAAQAGPQYRLSYELLNGVLTGKSELKMPGEADFISYLEWSGRRR
ncbi:MAG: hypothetical protein ABSF70_11885 [Terracidiphilus sp.]|jgi:hypothetical protein